MPVISRLFECPIKVSLNVIIITSKSFAYPDLPSKRHPTKRMFTPLSLSLVVKNLNQTTEFRAPRDYKNQMVVRLW
jgi:hypothetical protein